MIASRELPHFEDYEVGQTFVTQARTVTETDIVNYCALSGNWHPLHSDAEYCKGTMYGQRIVQGALVYTIALGLALPMPEVQGATVANYGTDVLRFPKPTFIGDTIHVEVHVTDKLDHRLGGVVCMRYDVTNQRGELCSQFKVRQIVKRRGTAAEAQG
jgi:3-hydroxybutyryl-CoA dehydratase